MPVWKQLAQSTPKVSPGAVSNSSKTNISNFNLQYDSKKKIITYYGSVASSSMPGGYNVIISFLNVGPEDGLTDDEILQGFKPKPSLANNEVQVRCSCPAYRFRFDQANRSHGAGTGKKFPNYHRKTDRAPNNPNNLPGFCKHLLEFVEYLQRQGFIH